LQCQQGQQGAPPVQQDVPEGMYGLRRRLLLAGFDKSVVDVMVCSTRPSTRKQYDPHQREWQKFCKIRCWDSVKSEVSKVTLFLQSLFDKGLSHSTIGVARSALATTVELPDGQLLGQHRDIHMYLQAVLNLRPPAVRYDVIWEPEQVFEWMRKQDSVKNVTTEWLTKRLAFLILIISGQRTQVLPALRLSKMDMLQDVVTFHVNAADLKHGRYCPQGHTIVLEEFVEQDICIIAHLKEYLKRTSKLRGKEDRLFLITVKPYTPATLNTTSRWVKDVLQATGIDIAKFSAGSTRAAATSKAYAGGVPTDLLMKSAGWKRATTFSKFYKKEVISKEGLTNYIA